MTVVLLVLLGTVGASDRARPAYDSYVSLGDSYTAAPFVPLTDVASGCYRSSNNYPRLLAAALHVDELDDRSCSGAQTQDLPQSQRTSFGATVPPQFAALTEAINARRPADQQLVIPQLDYRLWKTYHATWWPHHLTRTIMY